MQLVFVDAKGNRDYNGWAALKDSTGGDIFEWKDYGSNGNYSNRNQLNANLFNDVLTEEKLEELAGLATDVSDDVLGWVPDWTN